MAPSVRRRDGRDIGARRRRRPPLMTRQSSGTGVAASAVRPGDDLTDGGADRRVPAPATRASAVGDPRQTPRHGLHAHRGPGRAPRPRPHATSSTTSSRSRPSSSATDASTTRRRTELKRVAIEPPAPRRQPPARAPAARAGRRSSRSLVHEQLGQATGGLWSFIPGRLQRARPLHAGAARPLPGPEPARRAQRLVRDHRGRPGLGRPDAHLDRGPRRRHRRVRAQRREVVRDRPVRHGLHDLPLPRAATAASACRRCSSSTTTRPASS